MRESWNLGPNGASTGQNQFHFVYNLFSGISTLLRAASMSFDAEVDKSVSKSPSDTADSDGSSQYSNVSSGSSIPSLPATPTFMGSIPAARGGEGNVPRGGNIGNLTPGGLSSASTIKGGSTRAARPTSIALKPLDSPQKTAAYEKGYRACLNALKPVVDSPQKSSAYEKGYQACLNLFREKQKQQQELKRMKQAKKEDLSSYKKGYHACLEYFKSRPLSQALTPENIRALKTFPGALHGRGGSLPGTPLGTLAGTPLGSLPGTPLGNLLNSLPGTPWGQIRGLAGTPLKDANTGTPQKEVQSPIVIIPSSPVTPTGSPLLPIYARPPFVNPVLLRIPAILTSPVGLASPGHVASPLGQKSPAAVTSPATLANPGNMLSLAAHAVSPGPILSPGHIRSPGHIGSPIQLVNPQHLPSPSRTIVTGFPGPGSRPTGFPGPSSLTREEPPKKVQVLPQANEMPSPCEPPVPRPSKALTTPTTQDGHVLRSKPAIQSPQVPLPPLPPPTPPPQPPPLSFPIIPTVPRQKFPEVPDSPLLQLATAAITQARQVVPPKGAPPQVTPEWTSSKQERPSVTSTESYIESDASRSPSQCSSRGM